MIVKVPKGKSFKMFLEEGTACSEAVDWVGNKSLQCAWKRCTNPDWMLWLAEELGVPNQYLLPIVLEIYTATLTDKELKHPIVKKGFRLCRSWLRKESFMELENIESFTFDLCRVNIGTKLDHIPALTINLMNTTIDRVASMTVYDLYDTLYVQKGKEVDSKIGADIVRKYIEVRDRKLYVLKNGEFYECS